MTRKAKPREGTILRSEAGTPTAVVIRADTLGGRATGLLEMAATVHGVYSVDPSALFALAERVQATEWLGCSASRSADSHGDWAPDGDLKASIWVIVDFPTEDEFLAIRA